MSSVYFLGDLHLDHKAICKYRTDFESVEQHNKVIKELYHKKVTKRDKVFFMGDVAFSDEALEDLKNWKGLKFLIVGNHDLDFHKMKDLCEVFEDVYGLLKYKEFWLSHAPIHPDELRGKVNIHGHVHSKSIPDCRYFNTSIEVINFVPIELHEIRKKLATNVKT